jgi:ankyrin repeat protein
MDARRILILRCIYHNDSQRLCSLLQDLQLSVDEPLTKDYKTALHWAVILNRLDVVRTLLKSLRAQVDIPDYEGFTPLMCAAAQGNGELNAVARLLIHYKADIRFATKFTGFDSALDMAEAAFERNPELFLFMKQELDTAKTWERRRFLIGMRSHCDRLRLL